MNLTSLQRSRRRFGAAALLLVGLGLAWFFAPGLPVLWGPWARASVKAEGRDLFLHEWEPNDPLASGDGLGPVYNARSCVACHFQGGVGGGGALAHNVTTFEISPTRRDPNLTAGVLHAFATQPAALETDAVLRQRFPIDKGSVTVVNNCTVTTVDFDPVRVESLNATALFGAGWVDRISGKSITHNQMLRALENSARELELKFDGISAGRPRILPDGRVGKFGWKAQFATLDEFVASACANELGLGTPTVAQARPLGRPDGPDAKPDLTRKQVAALVAFVDTLPRPVEVVPTDPSERARSAHGKTLFGSLGCAVCHTPNLGGVKSVYSDFLLHSLDDPTAPGGPYGGPSPLPRPDDVPRPDEWKTPALWGVADSAPYFHDGQSPTLREAILRHRGDAVKVTEAYQKLAKEDQEAVIAFLQTLKAPADAEPAAPDPTEVPRP